MPVIKTIPMNNRRHITLIGAAVTITASLVLLSCGEKPAGDVPVRPVKLITVGSSALSPVVELAGEVRARVESRLGFRVGGKIIARGVEAGQRVRRGQELARIDPRDYQLTHNNAGAQMAAAKADLDIARSELKRFEDLHQRGFVSAHELDRKRMMVSITEAEFTKADNGVALEKNRLGDTVLRADTDGVITRIDADVGEVVAAGTPVITLAGDGARDIVVEFPEDRLALARITVASVSLWAAPDKKFPAKLRELAASADPATRTFRARYSVTAPAEALALGQSATLDLRMPGIKKPDATGGHGGIRLPTTALNEDQGATRVWVYDPVTGIVKRVPIKIVGLDGNEVIVSGLADGDQVVVAGVHVLTDGQKVRPLISTLR